MPLQPKKGSLKKDIISKDKIVKDVIKKDSSPGSTKWNQQFANKSVADSALIYLNKAVKKDATGKNKLIDSKSYENYLKQYTKKLKIGGAVKTKKKK